MRHITLMIMIICLPVLSSAGHMIKEYEHKGRYGYPDNRVTGYEILGWGMYGPWSSGDSLFPGVPGYGNCSMYGNYGITLPGITGPGMWGYDAGKYDRFLKDTADMRRSLVIKQFDYNEALRDKRVSSGDLIKMERDMLELEMKIKEYWWSQIE